MDGNGTTYAMFVSGNGVNIRGFSFINSKRGIGVISGKVMIFNNSFSVNNTYGIEIQNADGVHIENNEFRNCKASGIGITDSRDITILNCEFSNNGYGVSYLSGTKSIVEECEFRNHSMGIYLYDSRDVRIRHNSFSNSTRAGISIFGDHNDIDIRDNTFDEFRYEVRIYGRDDEGAWGNTFVVASVVIIAGMVMVAAVIFIRIHRSVTKHALTHDGQLPVPGGQSPIPVHPPPVPTGMASIHRSPSTFPISQSRTHDDPSPLPEVHSTGSQGETKRIIPDGPDNEL